ncbi:MAG: sigma-54-dependent Fis family transcriptional regulator [Deltaproteobacteria bacterium]|nr:MAG: sigma-54-dependent Fis family transcriptional regulator [Deltaproteobacteria bacterium]
MLTNNEEKAKHTEEWKWRSNNSLRRNAYPSDASLQHTTERKADVDELIEGVVDLAGEVPFLVFGSQGEIIKHSDGATELLGGAMELQGQRINLVPPGSGIGLHPLLQREWLEETVLLDDNKGQHKAFRMYARPIPPENPKWVLVRLDNTPIPLTDREGLRIRPAHEYNGMVEFFGMWTRSSKMRDLFQVMERVADIDVTILVRGESGTGKERVAQALHSMSKRADAPFVAVNCAALNPTLLESELFGHVKGAFTGAVRDRPGLFEQAHGGTIFLDEVAEIPLELQAKLLRVLQERTYTPVGSSVNKHVDVRVISATHQSLRQAVSRGDFREDLMFRLRVVPLWLPPLRERREDVELLSSAFLYNMGHSGHHSFSRVHPAAMQALLDYSWPGNVRELQNTLEYASAVGSGETLLPNFLPPEIRNKQQVAPPWAQGEANVPQPVHHQEESFLNPLSMEGEKQRILQALIRSQGKKGQAAKELGMHRTTLWRKIRYYGLDQD